MYLLKLVIFTVPITFAVTQLTKCDQKSPKVNVDAQPQNPDRYFELSIESNNQAITQENRQYLPEQTYLIRLLSKNDHHPFKWFMITVEDPDTESVNDREYIDVGSLKLLSNKSRYSERCSNSIEETDNSDKYKIEVHWLSPKKSDGKNVRVRAMVAENNEVWYEGGNLIFDIEKNVQRQPDAPPYEVLENCPLCSEARYEITFQGKWSRLTHPRHFPTKPYETGYSAMIGASHANDFILWKPDTEATNGLQLLAEHGNITEIQEFIITNIREESGVRTLIKGKGHFHPRMFESSYALFRVDRFHHLFSILVALRPSPDWFLGTSAFELCTNDGWLKEYEMPLYPWDAGTASGVSYESEASVPASRDLVGRVKLGSLDPDSPFYQVNLNDLKPFATIHVRRLDVYPITDGSCDTEEAEGGGDSKIAMDKNNDDLESASADEAVRDSTYYGVFEEPRVMESKRARNCLLSEWGEWSPCAPLDGNCGMGTQNRFRYRDDTNIHIRYYSTKDNGRADFTSDCNDMNTQSTQTQECFVKCVGLK